MTTAQLKLELDRLAKKSARGEVYYSAHLTTLAGLAGDLAATPRTAETALDVEEKARGVLGSIKELESAPLTANGMPRR